ncbi:MAG: hypothetical protein L3J02_05440 [Henriciella sp.]|nr:hypothetical protein [Henriciella sp.]
MTTTTDDNNAINGLMDILEAEKTLLQSGRAQDTVSLIEDKMSAIQAFETAFEAQSQNSISSLQHRNIQAIIKMAKENSAHFEAIRNGLSSAITRLEALHGSAYVGSYKQDGEKIPFSGATGRYLSKV